MKNRCPKTGVEMPQYVITVKIRGFCPGGKDEARRSLLERLIKTGQFDEKDLEIVSIEEKGKTRKNEAKHYCFTCRKWISESQWADHNLHQTSVTSRIISV